MSYELSEDYYDFSGDEPAPQPDYEHSGELMDFCGEPLGPPPVIGLGERLNEPEGVISEAAALGRWIIDVPMRFVRAVAGGAPNADDRRQDE